MEMTGSARGAAAKTQSKFDSFMNCLYEFYFENRTGPYISYGLALVSALVYSVIGHFAFGRSEEAVVFESVAIAVALTIVIPIAYGLGKTGSSFKALERCIAVLANLVVISGIVFAIIQIKQASKLDKRRIAIEAISQTRTSDFLKAHARLKTVYYSKQIKDKDSLIDDLNYVMNSYDNIAILYISDVADRCLLKDAIYSGLGDISPVLDALSYPKEYRDNFDALVGLMKQERCD